MMPERRPDVASRKLVSRQRSQFRYVDVAVKFPAAILATILLAQSGDSSGLERLAFWSRADLKKMSARLEAIDAELITLPAPAVINSGSRTGFQTGRAEDEAELWVEIVLPAATAVDSVVIVPALVKGANARIPGYGFPTRFRLEGFDASGTAHTLLDATAHDFPNPGAYPVIAKFEPQQLKRIRLTATEPWESDGPRVLVLAEMLVLSGTRNVALEGKVQSTSSRDNPPSWSRGNLNDMTTPLGLPVSPQQVPQLGYHSAISRTADAEKSITIALPQTIRLDEIALVPMRRTEVPNWFAYGFPSRFKVETATELDFRDVKLIHEHLNRALPSPGQNMMCFALPQQPVRYIRITATRLWERSGDFVFALAEVMAFKDGKNHALNARVIASDTLDDPQFSPQALTDGLAATGPLLDLLTWFTRLERRRVLEHEHSELTTQRTQLIARSQQLIVTGSTSIATALALLSAFALLRLRHIRKRDAERLREKLARDLHDEIGSNLGSIALISAFATQDDATPDTMRTDLLEIERVARESADSMRDMVHLISPRRSIADKDWLTVLRGLAERSLRGITTDIQLTASAPDLETRRELYLFIKEVLHNIAKHSQATHVTFHLTQDATAIVIQITDNGIGFDPAQTSSGHGLSNLRERAATIKAKLDIQSAPNQGTTIALHIPA